MSERKIIHDLDVGFNDDVSRMMAEAMRRSEASRPGMVTVDHDTFSGLRYIDDEYFAGRTGLVGYSNADGIGTKIEVAERRKDHTSPPYDLCSMTCDDAAAKGAEPLGITTVVDFRILEDEESARRAVDQMIEGYVGAALTAQIVILNGEVATLGYRVGGYGEFNYNWCGVVNWKAHKSRLLSGREIQPGNTLVGLEEKGFRSNGYTDLRKGMLAGYGEMWHDQVVKELGAATLGELAQRPSTIYTPLINHLRGGYRLENPEKAKITGIAHITGGGQPSKLGRMLEPSGYGVVIDSPIEPPAIMKHVQQLCGYSDRTAYRTWHMGPGMVLVTSEPEKVLSEYEGSKAIGYVTEEPVICIKNCGADQQEEWLTF